MADASQTPNPLDACLRDGRDEEFQKCLGMLELCNRSLAEYLETKRKKFPRFYFIAAGDLVDVLSKGRQPPRIVDHGNTDLICFLFNGANTHVHPHARTRQAQ